MGDPIVHWELGADDASALRSFYAEVFGWRIDTEGDYGFIDTGTELGVNGGIRQNDGGAPTYQAVYVQVDDIEGSLARAERAGAQRLLEPTDAGSGRVAMFTDPEGNVIGLLASAGDA